MNLHPAALRSPIAPQGAPARPARARAWPLPSALALAAVLALAGCASPAPTGRATLAIGADRFKEAPATPGWTVARPADEAPRGPWWEAFGDATLNGLLPQVEVSNQGIAAAVARYAQAQALVDGQRAGQRPSLGATAGATRSGSGSGGDGATALRATLNAAWEPDLWGRLAAGVAQARANAGASAADLANATLSAQAALASNYFALRGADAELALLRATVEGYERSQQIARNRYEAGLAARTDVLQAETQLANARADLASLVAQRQQLEHAIAVLLGRAPADFTLAPAAWTQRVPEVPGLLPSQLLERRPDIAAAQRAVEAANAQIGIARSAYYPSLSLSASAGGSASRLADLFSASHTLWSLGLSLAQTLFDGGALDAALRGAQAGREATVASYRQTVLAAFQDVEDRLSTRRALNDQLALRRQASAAADLTEQQVLNRYRAGQVGYGDVVTAQTSALSARRALVQLQADLQTNAVGLVQALGGGWRDDGAPA
ncbi:RND efflux system, outer membrane lipoprotein, NodT family [Piscinibacter sakaiensis]|uniref:RND efflux system, outer membrane lipoprotein, NodT family n=1 Tax=Piscinibacter sakaiensis TaxID=1547922 RepID=A0A0K8P3S9_PISS1|nr:RND efflux system, outer membrane lipoprotein, NodT family [Piscinibacter sakaiensis]